MRLYEALQLPLSTMKSEAAPAAFEESHIECAIRDLHIEVSSPMIFALSAKRLKALSCSPNQSATSNETLGGLHHSNDA